ncbi:MAG: hypothetical protein ACRC6I_01860 [Paracoccaceae bacterium]
MTPQELEARGIKVRELEWFSQSIYLIAMIASHSALIVRGSWVYSLAEYKDGTTKLWIEGVEIAEFATLDAAKAAAQLDYATRIAAALECTE